MWCGVCWLVLVVGGVEWLGFGIVGWYWFSLVSCLGVWLLVVWVLGLCFIVVVIGLGVWLDGVVKGWMVWGCVCEEKG